MIAWEPKKDGSLADKGAANGKGSTPNCLSTRSELGLTADPELIDEVHCNRISDVQTSLDFSESSPNGSDSRLVSRTYTFKVTRYYNSGEMER